jgi:glucose-6-phosphate 1-dehydrogenase
MSEPHSDALVFFGATGDLAYKKIFPALQGMARRGHTHNGVTVGTTFVAAHAGESLSLLTLAVARKMTPAELAAVIHCYPTQVEAIQRVAAQAGTS